MFHFHKNYAFYSFNQKYYFKYRAAYKQTMERDQKIRNLGYELYSIWECQFDTYLRTHPQEHFRLLNGESIEFDISDLPIIKPGLIYVDAATQTEPEELPHIELLTISDKKPNWFDEDDTIYDEGDNIPSKSDVDCFTNCAIM